MRDLPPIHQCCAVYSHFNEEHDDSPVEHDGFFRKPKPWWLPICWSIHRLKLHIVGWKIPAFPTQCQPWNW